MSLLCSENGTAAASPPARPKVTAMQAEPLRILIVDDEPAILRTLKGFLTLQGHHCEGETDPEQALRRLEEGLYHLLITDLVMPGMDGLELVRRLRETDSLAEVIVMTAFSSLDRAVEAYRLRISDYLLKPFESLEQVGSVVRQAEARHRRWREALIRTMDGGNGS